MPNYNPSTPDTVGLEWLPADPGPSTVVLDSATKAAAQQVPGVAGIGNAASLAAFLSTVNGQSTVGFEVYSSPFLDSVPQFYDIDYPGTDTGKDTTSVRNGGDAWVTQTGAAATFGSVSPGSDDVTYLRNVTGSAEYPACRMFFRGNNFSSTLQKAGKRVLQVEVHARVKSTQTASPLLNGALVLSGTIYTGTQVAAPTNVGYQDLTLGSWAYNPRTGVPWTLADVNNLLTSGGTDSFGLTAIWAFQQPDSVRVSALYVRIRWQAEDRLGYGTIQPSAAGWQTIAGKSVPNLLSKQDSQLDANTGNTGTWQFSGTNTALANDTVTKAGYTRSLKLTSTAAGTIIALTGFYPAIAGKSYSLSAYVNAVAGRNVILSILFYDSFGTLLQTTDGPTLAGSGAYTSYSTTPTSATAPAGATQMKAQIRATATAGAQTINAQGFLLGLDQAASILVFDVSAGGGGSSKIDGAAEIATFVQPAPALQVLRRVAGPGTVSVPRIPAGASGVGTGRAGFSSYKPVAQDAAGALYALGASAPDLLPLVSNATHNIEATNGPESAYSQPYAARIAGNVDTANTIKAELTLPAATFGTVRFVVAAQVDPPAAALNVKLRKTSDNSQIGSTLVVNPTDLSRLVPSGGSIASRTTPQIFTGAIGSATSVGAQYYLEFTSTAAVGSGWTVYALSTGAYVNDSVSANTIVFGLDVDGWTDPRNGGRQTQRNGLATVQLAPAAPSGFAGSAQAGFNRSTWTATALGSKFSGYEVWRSEDGGTTFVQIADLNTEAQVRFDDYESPRGVAAIYKARVRRKDGGLSVFTANTAGLTQTLAAGRYRFVTNEVASGGPALELVDYSKASNFTARSWDFVLSPQELEFEGRDGAVVFLPTENEGDRFTVPLAIYAEGGEDGLVAAPPSAALKGRAAFEALRVLTRQAVSYLCVLDSEGGRWYATVVLQNPTREEPGQLYTVDAVVRQTATTPSTPTVSP